jgi:hypothetical protein
VRNPHYRSAASSLLIDEDELNKNLEKIKQLPKYSEEELMKRKEYSKRSRKITKITFFCPNCKKAVRPLKDALTRKALYSNKVSFEEAKIVAVVTHYRHVHTDYDKERKSDELVEKYMDDADKFRSILFEYEYAKEEEDFGTAEKYLAQIRMMKSAAIEKIKDKYTREAIDLAKKDGLLPQDLTKEEYDRIADKIKSLG